MDFEELQKQLKNFMNERNNQPKSQFEGYSPFEMYHLLNIPFGPDSPFKLKRLSESDYQKIPLLNQIKYLTDLLSEKGEIKLTQKGFLPVKIVADIYNKGFFKEKYIESGLTKLYKEVDSMSVHLTRIITIVSKLTKKRQGKLSLTKAGEKIITDNEALLKTTFEAFTTRFNWAFLDRYGENNIGQLGFGFSLILLSKYGSEKRRDQFYAEKYFNAFPSLIESNPPNDFQLVGRYDSLCYSLRTFDRFLELFGLITIEMADKSWFADKYITKTRLFDKLIEVHHH